MKSILLISGPNLNLLGEREPDIYGDASLDDLVELATSVAFAQGYELLHRQYNDEGGIVEEIHSARGIHEGIIINPGALTHYGLSLIHI